MKEAVFRSAYSARVDDHKLFVMPFRDKPTVAVDGISDKKNYEVNMKFNCLEFLERFDSELTRGLVYSLSHANRFTQWGDVDKIWIPGLRMKFP